MNEVPLSW